MNTNPNNFDFFDAHDVFEYQKGKVVGNNNLDYFDSQGNVLEYVFLEITETPVVVISPRRRLFFIE